MPAKIHSYTARVSFSYCRLEVLVTYICGVTIQDFSALFRSELNAIYSPGEVDAMWNWFLSERFSEQLDPIRRNLSASIDDGLLSKVKSDLFRLQSGEPFQYVMGHAFFFGMRLSVDERVLIPRPETEEMLELIVSQKGFEPENVVDVCTGSGCIALGLKKSFPSARVLGLDVSSGAIDLATLNAMHNGLHIEWILQDVLLKDWSEALPQQSHLVVSNPPYILPSESHSMHASVLEHEPSLALFVPQEDPLLFYKPIAEFARRTLVPGGQLWFEINPQKSIQVAQMLEATGFLSVTIVNDLSGKARFAKAIQ